MPNSERTDQAPTRIWPYQSALEINSISVAGHRILYEDPNVRSPLEGSCFRSGPDIPCPPDGKSVAGKYVVRLLHVSQMAVRS